MHKTQEIIAGLKLPFVPAPRQLEVIEEAYERDRFGFFNDVGTGKTFCSTVVALAWEVPQIILICPPILQRSWERWLHTIGEMNTSVYRGPQRTVEMLQAKWVIMSHAIFRGSFTVIQKDFIRKDFCMIVDEAQALKNPKSQLYRKVLSLVGTDKQVLLLTATPTSKPEDTYTYMKIKTPHVYRSYGQWSNIHIEAVDIFGSVTKYAELERLADNFAMASSKLTKKDIFGDTIPDPIYDAMEYDLSPAHQKLYKKLAEEQLLIHTDGNKIDASTPQKLRHALQQIVVNFGKFSGEADDVSETYRLIDSVCDQVQPMLPGHSKLVIWTWYRHTSAEVTKYLKEKFGDKAVVAAYGGVNSQKAVDAIMFDDECRIMVAQPTSVGAGLDLQHVCWEMLLVEMSTTPMHIRQLIGRVDRAGQVNRPTIRFGIARKTIQVRLHKDLLNNDDLVSKVERTVDDLRSMIYGEE